MDVFTDWGTLLTVIGIVQAVVVAPIVFVWRKLVTIQHALDERPTFQEVHNKMKESEDYMKEYITLTQEPIKQTCDSIKEDVAYIRKLLEARSRGN